MEKQVHEEYRFHDRKRSTAASWQMMSGASVGPSGRQQKHVFVWCSHGPAHMLCCLQSVCRSGPRPTLQDGRAKGWGVGLAVVKPARASNGAVDDNEAPATDLKLESVARVLPSTAPFDGLAIVSPLSLICTNRLTLFILKRFALTTCCRHEKRSHACFCACHVVHR